MNTAQRVLKNTASLFLANIISQMAGLAMTVYLARVLLPTGFGTINFAVAIIAYFTLIGNLGLPVLGARQVARERDSAGAYVGKVMMLRLSLAIVSLGLVSLLALLLNKPPEIKYLLLLYGVRLLPVAIFLDWAFQGMERMEYTGLANILRTLVELGLVVALVKSPDRLLLVPAISIISNSLAAGFLVAIFRKRFGRFRLDFNLLAWKDLARQALPIGLSALMIQVIYNTNIVILGFMKGEEQVGYYIAGYSIIQLAQLVMVPYHDAVFPLMSKYFNTAMTSLRTLQQYSVKLMVVLGLPLAVGGTVLGGPMIHFVYGGSYSQGVVVLQIMAWVPVLIYINTVYARGLWACDKQSSYLAIVTVQAITNMALNLVLIPVIGLPGAGLSVLAAELVGIPLYYRQFSRLMTVPFLGYIFKPLLCSAVMGLFLYWALNNINLSLLLLLVSGALLYFLLLLLVKGITREEVRQLRAMF